MGKTRQTPRFFLTPAEWRISAGLGSARRLVRRFPPHAKRSFSPAPRSISRPDASSHPNRISSVAIGSGTFVPPTPLRSEERDGDSGGYPLHGAMSKADVERLRTECSHPARRGNRLRLRPFVAVAQRLPGDSDVAGGLRGPCSSTLRSSRFCGVGPQPAAS